MRIRTALLALALIVAACGDDGAGATTTALPTTEAATTSQAPATTAPTTTEAPATTQATTTTADPMAEVTALIGQYEGAYEGTWNNTTFDSEGPITGNLAFDPASLTMTIDLDLGGFVFGAVDPEPESFVISFADLTPDAGGAVTFSSATFGDMQVTMTAEGLEILSADVPDPGIASILVTGPITPGAFDLTYVIEFEGGGGAEGTATIQKTG